MMKKLSRDYRYLMFISGVMRDEGLLGSSLSVQCGEKRLSSCLKSAFILGKNIWRSGVNFVSRKNGGYFVRKMRGEHSEVERIRESFGRFLLIMLSGSRRTESFILFPFIDHFANESSILCLLFCFLLHSFFFQFIFPRFAFAGKCDFSV